MLPTQQFSTQPGVRRTVIFPAYFVMSDLVGFAHVFDGVFRAEADNVQELRSELEARKREIQILQASPFERGIQILNQGSFFFQD